MKVSDEDIDSLWFDMGPGQSETLGEIVAELRALRKVADAARAMADERMSDGCDDGGNAMRERALYAALREAGR